MNNEILDDINEKWGEYLEMLSPNDIEKAQITILCMEVKKLQEENKYLRKLRYASV